MHRYSETIRAPWTFWLIAVALTGSLGIAFGAAAGWGWGLVTFVIAQGIATAMLVGWTSRIVIDDSEFHAGPAHIALGYIVGVQTLDPDATREVRTVKADARAFLDYRGWVRASVRIDIEDDEDPTPYWLVSTKRPRDLATALIAAIQSHSPRDGSTTAQ